MIPLRVHVTVFFWLFAPCSCNAATNVACVDDSITAGVGVNNPTVESYPAKLQNLLGTNYVVQNDGVSGTTLLTNGDMPYRNTIYYAVSRATPKPDIVTCHKFHHWTIFPVSTLESINSKQLIGCKNP